MSYTTHWESQVKMCDCARCKKELLGIVMVGVRVPKIYQREFVYGRLSKRPYCKSCYQKDRAIHDQRQIYFQHPSITKA